MPWLILVSSAIFEAVWAVALGHSNGFSKPLPTVIFAVALLISMGGLGWAVKNIPIGTAYVVWTGIGAALAVIYTMATGDETVSLAKIIFLSGIIAAVAGLKLLPEQTPQTTQPHTETRRRS
ncbi:MAG: multidrug efflux SMR transporter [Acidimicrobiia bacterium]